MVRFVGACIDYPICILSEFCAKRSLYEIMNAAEINLDLTFQISLIGDLVSGMTYLHNSPIAFHGNLKSTNCLVDARFVLKIGDYGVRTMRNGMLAYRV